MIDETLRVCFVDLEDKIKGKWKRMKRKTESWKLERKAEKRKGSRMQQITHANLSSHSVKSRLSKVHFAYLLGEFGLSFLNR